MNSQVKYLVAITLTRKWINDIALVLTTAKRCAIHAQVGRHGVSASTDIVLYFL